MLGSRPVTQKNVYLDNNATTPLHPEFKRELPAIVDAWGNPSSIHWHGREPKRLIRESRQSLSELLDCQTTELIFTSGGSESNNLAIKGLWEATRQTHPQKNKIIISAIEHPSIVETVKYLSEKHSAIVVKIPVNREGLLDEDILTRELDDSVLLVSVMFANNETGTVFDIKKLAKKAHAVGAFFHCDGVQSLGKMKFSLKSLDVDMMSFVSHKFYALKGAGVLYVKRGTPVDSVNHGGAQERRRRAGTENVLAIASVGFMAEKIKQELDQKLLHMQKLRDYMEARIKNEIPGVVVNAEKNKRLVNTSSLVLSGVDGESLLMSLDIKGFSVSTGAACSSGSPEPSPVLLAIGLTRLEAQSSLRISLGWFNTIEEIDAFIDQLVKIVFHLRNINQQESGALHVSP